jgi:hypothetical protein
MTHNRSIREVESPVYSVLLGKTLVPLKVPWITVQKKVADVEKAA